MSARPSAIFLAHLVQDVSILRPLIAMSGRDFGFETIILVSAKFAARDVLGIWRNELSQIAADFGARVAYFGDDWEAQKELAGHGILFAASESDLPQHSTAHNVFRHAPASFLRVTLQHGYECIGFRHSAEHVHAHGGTASFSADVVCGWADAKHLSSLAASERSKLLATGPTHVLQLPSGEVDRTPGSPGLVCENLHSVRYRGATDVKAEFIATFEKFARRRAAEGQQIRLRAHPGGQYMVRNRVALPPNVTIENAPMYRLDLRQFSYGVSGPSSVLIDLLLADVPTAVWRDREGHIDAGSYAGLPTVSSVDEWTEFARAAECERDKLVANQREFLRATGMILDPREVFYRFAGLFESARRRSSPLRFTAISSMSPEVSDRELDSVDSIHPPHLHDG